MAVTEQTRTQLIGLSVAMLGQAPGAKQLQEWIDALNDGMSLGDLAEHIADSEAFKSQYGLSTNAEFAADFLGAVMDGNASEAALTAAVGVVVGLLNADDPASRADVALLLVNVLMDLAGDEDNDLYANYGKAAEAFHNKVEVAEHYTLNAKMDEPSSSVLDNVTDAADSVTAAINNIDNPPQPPAEPETGKRLVLTPTIDDFEGGDLDDTFVAQPVQGADGLFNETLNSFDSIDGGGGTDTIHIFGVRPGDTLRLGAEDITNVENVVINTVGGIDADLSDWTGLEMVKLDRFGRDDDSNVRIIVDGAAVNSDRPFNGNVTMVGADGAVDIAASGTSVVHIGSDGHTETVMVKGGASVRVDNGAGGGNRQSQTVTAVIVDGVARDAGTPTEAKEEDTSKVREAEVPSDNVSRSPDATTLQYVRLATEAEVDAGNTTGVVAVPPPTATQEALGTLTYYIAPQGGLPEGALDGQILVTTDIEMAEGYIEATGAGTTGAGDPTLTVNSDAIEMVHLHNTTATALIDNNSKMDDGERMPEDLAVTVNKYGKFKPNGRDVDQYGELRIAGGDAGSAENIDIAVAGANAFNLASGRVKTLDISGEGGLVLNVNNYKEDADPSNDGVSKTLESVTVSGAVGVTMANLSGMEKLKMIDASESSGTNHFRSQAGQAPAGSDQLAALTMVKGGSGRDIFTLRTSVTGKLEDVHTGDGNDSVTITGMLRNGGIEVDLGAGNDTYSGRASNGKSRIDGGEGTDTLHLTSTQSSTYRDADNKEQSIYTGFETLDVARGSGDYDIEQLGIENDVLVTASTSSAVTLKNMGDGMGIRVDGVQGSGSLPNASTDTSATITHESADGRQTDSLSVHLAAFGRNDTRMEQEGVAKLTLTTDTETEVINISSNATAHSASSTPAIQRARTSDYKNELMLTGSSTVEELIVSGNAHLVITVNPTAQTSLDEVDARGNSGGVTFTGAPDTGIELTGGSGKDNFTGAGGVDEISGGAGVDTLNGAGENDEITGGAGGDILTGGTGDDDFIIKAVSDSQLSFNVVTDNPQGMDTIRDFDAGSDQIVLPKSLYESLQGLIKEVGTINGVSLTLGSNWGISGTITQEKVNEVADGFFETRTPIGGGFSGTTNKHSIAVIGEDVDADGTIGATDYTWIFIDIDGDGDLDLSTDHAIRLLGNHDLADTNFDDPS